MNPQQIIAQLFQQYLGRAPSQAELQGFGTALDKGVTDPIGLSLFLQGSSQAQMANIPQGMQGFQNQLQQGNQNILGQAFDQAQSRFAQQGRPFSSGVSGQFAQSASQLAAQQSPMMANYYGQLFQNAQNPNQYGQNYLGNQQNIQNQGFQNQQAQQANQWYQQALGQNMSQQNKNNWFGLGGSALGGLMQGGGMALGKSLFS